MALGELASRKVILQELSKIEIADIMIPRSEAVLINQNKSFSEIVDLVIQDGHSRYPVFSEKIDNIVGILYVKDLLQFFRSIEVDFNISRILRKPLFVSENKKANELLSEFREARSHIAIVVDEYGTMLGIVTLEDIIEEIVGDISDEYDEMGKKEDYILFDKDEYIVYPRMKLEEFNEVFKTRFNSEDYETVGGFVVGLFGYVPKAGESIEYGNYLFSIKLVEGSKIKEILFKKL